VDIIACVLSFNSFPAGDRELPSQTATMNMIGIDAEKPKNEQRCYVQNDQTQRRGAAGGFGGTSGQALRR
jgi:hypothetical protein